MVSYYDILQYYIIIPTMDPYKGIESSPVPFYNIISVIIFFLDTNKQHKLIEKLSDTKGKPNLLIVKIFS